MKSSHDMPIKILIFSSVFIISWVLGALRFQWDFISILYGIINIPFGALFLYLDNYLWTNFPSSSWLNNEFVGVLIWGLTVAGQGGIYYSLFKMIRNRRYKMGRKANG